MNSDDDSEKIKYPNPNDEDDDDDDEKMRPANDSDDEKEKVFQLFIKEISGKSTAVVCSPSDTISQLKEKISQSVNIKPNNQRLNFEGHDLSDDDKTIKDYDLKNGSTVHLIIRLTGGF